MIRQAAGSVDHPTGPTFLDPCRILSLYSTIKPPKYRNYTILDIVFSILFIITKILVTEVKEIFQGSEII